MSMVSAQIDGLRERAKVLRQGRWSDGADDARLMEDAADTIWQLRDDLQRANDAVRDAEHDESRAWDRVRKAEAEADRLRELVRRYVEYTSQDRCEGCVCKSRCNEGDVEECWQLTEIRGLARELGIGVDA